MKKILPHLLFLAVFYFPIHLAGQDFTPVDENVRDTIYLKNPSFEDIPRAGGSQRIPILDWEDCSGYYFSGETPPDIHPVPGGAWGVQGKAEDGETYLGMVVRQTATWESVSQRLKTALLKGKCYELHAYLSLSPVYFSGTKISDTLEDFSHPAVLRIWGGSDVCDKTELLSVSYPVANHDWKECVFHLNPTMTCHSITLEAFYYIPESNYSKERIKAYNGHIMIDHLSPIMEVECK